MSTGTKTESEAVTALRADQERLRKAIVLLLKYTHDDRPGRASPLTDARRFANAALTESCAATPGTIYSEGERVL